MLNKPTKLTTVNAVKDVSGIKTDHAAIAENVNSNFTDIGPRLAEQIPVSEVDAMSFLTQGKILILNLLL